MITIQDVVSLAVERPDGGKQTIIEANDFIISIVGGRQGLYGDFINDFEIALIDKDTREFITRKFFPESNDEVIPWTSSQ